MIKKFSVILLSGLFIMSTSSMCSQPKPYNKKHQKEEDEIRNSPQSPSAQRYPAVEHIPQVHLPQMAAPKPTPAPTTATLSAAASAVQSPAAAVVQKEKVEKPLRRVTVAELIERQKSFFNILGNSGTKYINGADAVVLSALAELKTSEEAVDCDDTDNQVQLGSGVRAIIAKDNLQGTIDLLRLCQMNRMRLEKTYRKSLRASIKKHREANAAKFKDTYNKIAASLEELVRVQTQNSKKFGELISSTYNLGGDLNYTDEELAFLQGDKSKLTKEQQQALAKKQKDRVHGGISDDEEEHDEYVDSQTVIRFTASQLSTLKPGSKSLKAKAETAKK